MQATTKESEVTWLDPVKIRFGFSGLTAEHAVPIVRAILRDSWPSMSRPVQCVCVICQ